MKDLPWEAMDALKLGTFKPVPYYNPATDTLTVFIADEEYERERINNLLTIYRSVDASRRVIGCHIKNLAKLIKEIESLGIDRKQQTLPVTLSSMNTAVGENVPRAFVTPFSHFARNVSMGDLVKT